MVTPRKILSASIFAILAFGAAHLLPAQTVVSMDQSSPDAGIGVPRYTGPEPARFRAIFGFGGNAGLGGLVPAAYVGDVSYQTGLSLLEAGVITSSSVTWPLPRRDYLEFDLLYGIALDQLLPRYERPSDDFHAALSVGISLNTYQTRWRIHRGFGPDSSFFLLPPNTFEYSLGLPIQFQAIYEPLSLFGIGVGIGGLLFCNISGFTPSYGGAIVVEASY
ncbi:MAG TPA: hypothetical protein VFH95_08020 [Candidatus Kapabacteria bacterium]|nr:hypothetical protein [Candidatus Kapabacteria bacterium]